MMQLAIGLGLLGFFLARRRRYLRRLYHGGPMGCYGFGPGLGEEGGEEGHERHHHHHHWGRDRFGGHRGHPMHGRGRSRMRRMMMHRLFRELDASPAQERAILAELDQLEQRVRAAGELVRDSKTELAQVVASPQLDEAALAAVTSRYDSATADVREAGVGTLRAIHALLDDVQRTRLAELMDRKPWWRGGGLYR
jgi:Spy/CpxP family protein refolding chaperone